MQEPDERSKGALFVALAGGLLAVYHLFLLPDLPADGDSAKLQVVASLLGTPHPSGYPTWVLSTHVFGRLLPWGSPAYAANLLTALFSVAGSCCLLGALFELRLRRTAAVATSFAFGMTPTLWSQSILAEVYSLHYLFLAAVTFLLLRWRNTTLAGAGDPRALYAASALYILSFSNHLTTLCLAPGILVFVLLTDPGALRNLRLVGVVVASAAATLALYGYILWRSAFPDAPFLETQAAGWGDLLGQLAGDPKRRHLFETELPVLLGERLPEAAGRLLREFLFWLPLAVFGLWRRPAPVHALFALFALGNLAFALSFTVPDDFVYFIPFYFVVAVYIGMGLDRLSEVFPSPAWLAALGIFGALLLGALQAPGIDAQHRFRLAEARRIGDIFGRLGSGPALVLSDRYGTSMGLLYRSLLENPRLRIRHLPPVSYEIPLAISPLRRYLEEGLPLRSSNYPEPFPAGYPVYCACQRPELLAPHGIRTESLGRGLYRLEAAPDLPPPVPRARLVHRLETSRDMVQALALLRGDPQDPDSPPLLRAVRLGSHPGASAPPPEQEARVRFLQADSRRIEISTSSTAPGWLVLNESLPARWKVTVDAEAARKLELDLMFVGVAVPAGEHRVVFYRS